MPVYIYRAATKSGQIVRNKVEEINKFALLKRIKNNNLFPINIIQINSRFNKNVKRQKRNVENTDSILKTIRTEENKKSYKKSKASMIKKVLFSNHKIMPRDIVVFTQNFYLLKKANFNNIQALTTIIESTENDNLKSVVEDILMGVEAGENIYTTMEYYKGIFSPIYINIIKVGELSRIIYKSFRTSYKIFR